jgi:hypothetical protein
MYHVFQVDPASTRYMPPVFPLPPLSTKAAHILAAFFAVSYVASLYISKNARISFAPKATHLGTGQLPHKAWSRDDPDIIKARMLAVSISTVLSCVSVFWLLWHIEGVRLTPFPPFHRSSQSLERPRSSRDHCSSFRAKDL